MKRELNWVVVVLVRAYFIGVVGRTRVTMSTMSFSVVVASLPMISATVAVS